MSETLTILDKLSKTVRAVLELSSVGVQRRDRDKKVLWK